MTNIHDIINNEQPEDVVLFLTMNGSIHHPQLDRYYNGNNWPFLKNNMELIYLVERMVNSGLITQSRMGYSRGPNWHEPEFVTKGKYKFEAN